MSTPTEKELRELDEWLAVNLFGWQKFREEEYPHRTLWREGEPGSRVWDEADFYTTDAAPAMMVLEKCTEATDDNRVIIRKSKRGWVVAGSNTSIYIEDKTLELAIARFAKELLGVAPHRRNPVGNYKRKASP